MLASSGYVSRVDPMLCIACGECADYCQFGALSLGESSSVVDEQVCMGCGICVSQCAQSALSLEQEPAKGEPLDVDELKAEDHVG